MCGIAGIVQSGLERGDLRMRLEAMQGALRHRGPDDRGLYLSPREGTGLVHTRLAILDLSSAGHQPMASADERFLIVFNGEIYNFRELRLELSRDGLVFRSDSDTEVILQLYERLGPACVERLRGMFAFAIWDEQERTCFLARDPLGIKPLYYHHAPELLIFASELRAVLASELLSPRLDPAAVAGYFQVGSVPEPATLVQGVQCLPAGHSLCWREGGLTTQRFWSLQFQPTLTGGSAVVPRVREALLDSVRQHFVSDVPVGIFLSGGVDSTAILALACVTGQSDLRTFSISVDDPTLNEGDLARQTAKHFAAKHADFRLDPATGRNLFQQFLGCLDQPSIDGFNTFTVAKFAHDHEMKVVLSGLGGDEVFGGYPSFVQVPQMVHWSRRLGLVEPLRALAGRFLERRAAHPRLRRLGYFLQQNPTTRAAFTTYRGVYSPNEARTLAARFARIPPEEIAEPVTGPAMQPTIEDQVSELEIELYMRNQLLRDSDVMSMAWGLELRVPFVDRCLMEVLAQVPAATRLQRGKRLLLQAVPEVPAWIASQPKRGFIFPFERWLADDWKEVFETCGRGSGVRAQTWYQKWSLFVLENWCTEMKISHY